VIRAVIGFLRENKGIEEVRRKPVANLIKRTIYLYPPIHESMMQKRAIITVSGEVQGVGPEYRPF
jgi:hypothetical protein